VSVTQQGRGKAQQQHAKRCLRFPLVQADKSADFNSAKEMDMHRSRFTRLFGTALAAALIALWPLTAQTFQFKEVDPSRSDPEWAPVTLVAGQNVRLNLANVAVDNPDYIPGDCQVQVSFLNASGLAVDNPDILELRPGQSVTVMGPTPHMRDGEQEPDSGDRVTRLIRATVRFVDNPDFKGLATPGCRVAPMMEVFSEETGATLFLSPAALKAFSPPPGQTQQAQ
jgi:hypothetical protein